MINRDSIVKRAIQTAKSYTPVMINRDSMELRRIVKRAIQYASSTNWDQVRTESGTDGVDNLIDVYVDAAIRDEP